MRMFLSIFIAMCELSLIFTSSASDIFHKQSILSNDSNSYLETKPQHHKHALDFRSPLLITYLNLQRLNSTTATKRNTNRKGNRQEGHKNRKDEKHRSYIYANLLGQQENIDTRDRGIVFRQVTVMENESGMARTRQTETNTAGKRTEPLHVEGWSTTSGPGWDKVTENHMEDFTAGNILHNNVIEDNHTLESTTPRSGLSLFQDDAGDDSNEGDKLRSRKWKRPPIDYYKCDKCICHYSDIGVTVHVDCRNLKLQHIPENLPKTSTDINLFHNHIYLAFKILPGYTPLHVLNVSSNGIIKLPSCTHNDSVSVQTLDLSDNQIETIEGHTLLCLPQLRTLHLQNNHIQVVTNLMLAGLPRLQHFDISNNHLQAIEVNAFLQCPELKILNLSTNKNMTYEKQRLNFTIFKQLKHIECQYIHGFGASTLYPIPILLELTNDTFTELSGNNIHRFNVNVSYLNNLRFLNLTWSAISWINKQTLDDLERINTRQGVSRELTLNPLPCSFPDLPLLQWLAKRKDRVLSKDFLICVNDVNELEDMGDLEELVIFSPANCVTIIVPILITSFSIVSVVAIALAVWMFRNRWRLHYLRNITIARFFGCKAKVGEDEKQYDYDAYILYSKEDKGFVLGDCLRELEAKRNHKLCVEDRDFLLGTFMTCTVTSAVCSSRLTIPLISPDFWASEWCEYGVQMAKMESIHTHRDVLHLLIYRPTPAEAMPENLLKLLKENPFCEYPPDGCDDNVRTAFWDALSKTIDHTQRQGIANENHQLASLLSVA